MSIFGRSLEKQIDAQTFRGGVRKQAWRKVDEWGRYGKKTGEKLCRTSPRSTVEDGEEADLPIGWEEQVEKGNSQASGLNYQVNFDVTDQHTV